MFGVVRILLKLWQTHTQEWLIMNTVYYIQITTSLELFETFVENKTMVLSYLREITVYVCFKIFIKNLLTIFSRNRRNRIQCPHGQIVPHSFCICDNVHGINQFGCFYLNTLILWCSILLSTLYKAYRDGRRSPAVACWASDRWVASSNPLRGKFRH